MPCAKDTSSALWVEELAAGAAEDMPEPEWSIPLIPPAPLEQAASRSTLLPAMARAAVIRIFTFVSSNQV